MKKWLSVVTLIIAILSAAGFPIAHHLGYVTSLDLEPTTESINNENHTQKVDIRNHGIMQAKNVDVFIKKNNMNLTNSFCLEGTITDNIDTDDYLKIHFPKISSGFECSLTFVGKNNTSIGLARISEEGRPADKWYISKDEVESRIFTRNLILLVSVIGFGISLSTIIWSWIITPKNKKKLEPNSKFRNFLLDQYSKSLCNYDEELILAIHNGKNSYESLNKKLKINKLFIRIRINFLYRKKILKSKNPIDLNSDIKTNIEN